jgi:hypothetical protein
MCVFPKAYPVLAQCNCLIARDHRIDDAHATARHDRGVQVIVALDDDLLAECATR